SGISVKNVARKCIAFFFATLTPFQFAEADAKAEIPAKIIAHEMYLESELGNDYTFVIAEDHNDFIWFGTDGGLKRYDGYNLVRFAHDPADPETLSANLIAALLKHSGGSLWIGANQLNRFNYDTEKFKRFDIYEGVSI